MLARRQILIVLSLGMTLWLVFTLAIRWTPFLFDQGLLNALLYLASLPAAWLLVSLIGRVAGLAETELLSGIALAICAASLCDGIGVAWFSTLYGSDPDHHRLGAAYILWGAGVFLLIALIRSQHALRRQAPSE